MTARKTTTWVLALGLILALCVLTVLTIGKPSGAASVAPVFVDGNPTCADRGYAHEFKVEPPATGPTFAGTYNLPGGIGTVTVTTQDDITFDWKVDPPSTFGMDAVIVKGGSNANAYVYDPPAESLGDTGLHSPINPNNDKPFGLSHISFCYDYEVQVSKTAQTSLERTHTWTIDKSADQTELTLQPGQSHDINYTAALNSTSADSNHAVEGVITIKNPDPSNPATVTEVTDQITGGIDADVTCDDEPFPITIPAGGESECQYSAALPDDSDRTNTATVKTSEESKVDGGSGTAPVSFANATVTETDESVDVNDSLQGVLGTDVNASDPPADRTFIYKRQVSFDECGEHFVDNTASFVTNDTRTEGSDDWSVKVTVPCAQGCTLTIGYWKTHGDRSSPRNDAGQTLDVLAEAQPLTLGNLAVTNENVVSLLSFSGDPSKPINKLYAQLLAAKLNIANGADGSAVATTIANADTFLTGKQPNQNLTNTQKQTSVSLAATLENFNSGGIGPGHCDEQ
jgi:hypothetical protein